MKIVSFFANTDTLTLVLFTASVVLVAVLAIIGLISFLCDNYTIKFYIIIVNKKKKK